MLNQSRKNILPYAGSKASQDAVCRRGAASTLFYLREACHLTRSVQAELLSFPSGQHARPA